MFECGSFSLTLTGVTEQILTGTGHGQVGGQSLLTADDITSVTLPVAYTSTTCSIPGQGLLSVESIDPSSFSSLLIDDGHPALRNDATGPARFTRLVPAQRPGTPPTPDPTPSSGGTWSLRPATPSVEISQ